MEDRFFFTVFAVHIKVKLEMAASANDRPKFSLSETRRIVHDLFRPNAFIYWTDFLVTYALGMICFQQVRGGTLFEPHQGFQASGSQTMFFLASCLLFYRAATFIHELAHQRRGSLTRFSIVWNLLCGIPFLTPSFVYYIHMEHHRRAHYGTERDGEYLPLVQRGPWHILFYLSWSFVIPILVAGRFFLLTPLCWVWPKLRSWVHQHASSMVMDPMFVRPLPTDRVRRTIRIQELACFLWCLGIAVVPPLFLNRWPIPFLVHAYLTGSAVILINSLRTLGAHRWANQGEEMSFLEQLTDSVNFPDRAYITELWGPVGTRYHALHHLFPSLPYHAMPEAHRRLMRELPADSPYRATVEKSLCGAIVKLWTRSRGKRESNDWQLEAT